MSAGSAEAASWPAASRARCKTASHSSPAEEWQGLLHSVLYKDQIDEVHRGPNRVQQDRFLSIPCQPRHSLRGAVKICSRDTLCGQRPKQTAKKQDDNGSTSAGQMN